MCLFERPFEAGGEILEDDAGEFSLRYVGDPPVEIDATLVNEREDLCPGYLKSVGGWMSVKSVGEMRQQKKKEDDDPP